MPVLPSPMCAGFKREAVAFASCPCAGTRRAAAGHTTALRQGSRLILGRRLLRGDVIAVVDAQSPVEIVGRNLDGGRSSILVVRPRRGDGWGALG